MKNETLIINYVLRMLEVGRRFELVIVLKTLLKMIEVLPYYEVNAVIPAILENDDAEEGQADA